MADPTGTTWAGFLRLQHGLAKRMLAQYPIPVDDFRLISSAANFIYRFLNQPSP